MPNLPSTDGLPALLQILVTLLVGVISAGVFWRSIKSVDQPHTQTTFAHLTDMQPVRDLVTQVQALCGLIEQLVKREQETEHWTRNHIEEMVRLRHSLEAMTRSFDRWRPD